MTCYLLIFVTIFNFSFLFLIFFLQNAPILSKYTALNVQYIYWHIYLSNQTSLNYFQFECLIYFFPQNMRYFLSSVVGTRKLRHIYVYGCCMCSYMVWYITYVQLPAGEAINQFYFLNSLFNAFNIIFFRDACMVQYGTHDFRFHSDDDY